MEALKELDQSMIFKWPSSQPAHSPYILAERLEFVHVVVPKTDWKTYS